MIYEWKRKIRVYNFWSIKMISKTLIFPWDSFHKYIFEESIITIFIELIFSISSTDPLNRKIDGAEIVPDFTNSDFRSHILELCFNNRIKGLGGYNFSQFPQKIHISLNKSKIEYLESEFYELFANYYEVNSIPIIFYYFWSDLQRK